MKRIITLISILSLAIALHAQDSLQREVTIIKDFTPIVRDAEKINSLPPINTPHFERRTVQYSFNTVPAHIASQPSIVEMPFSPRDVASKKMPRGYALFSLGSYLSMAANAGYHIVDTPNDQLNAALQFTSIDGDIPINSHADGVNEETTRQTFYDTRVGLHYAHKFHNNLSWSINGAYRFLHFNYYGVTGVQLPTMPSHPIQQVHNFFAEMQVDNKQAAQYDFEHWLIKAGYSLYSNRNGAYTPQPSQEHHAYINGYYQRMLNNKWSAGAHVNINYLKYNGILPTGSEATINTLPSTQHIFMASILPHLQWQTSRANFTIGAKVDISAGDGVLFRFAPEMRFNWEFVENYFLFIEATGGKQLHTWNSVSQHCFYFDPSQRIPSSYSPFDGQLGLRMHIIPELSLTLYGGYEAAEEALFQSLGYSPQTLTWRTLDAQCIKAGVRIDAHMGEYLKLSAQTAYRAWQHDGFQISYNRPRWEADAQLSIFPIKQVDVDIAYHMALGRVYDNNTSLNDIHNLQATIKYRPLEWLSVHIQGDNLLNRAHDYYYGVPAPRIQIMGGIAVKF